MQEDTGSLQKKLSEKDKLFRELSTAPGFALGTTKVSLEPLQVSESRLEELVHIRTEQLEKAAKELQETQTALLHAQKMESLGELATGMAHEINTPLQYIGGNLDFLDQAFAELTQCVASSMNLFEDLGVEDSALQTRKKKIDFVLTRLPRAIQQSKEGVENVSRIVRAMRRFSHIAQDKVEADLNEAMDSTLTVSKGEWKYVADVEFEADPDLPKVVCFPGDLNQVFLNIIVNAAQAIEEKIGSNPEEKGRISIRISHDDENVLIKIADTGSGIPEEVSDRIFDQFFTTKEVGKGTGQGLAICRSIIVEKHKGTIDVQSNPDLGTTFALTIPRHSDTALES